MEIKDHSLLSGLQSFSSMSDDAESESDFKIFVRMISEPVGGN